ncbi:hypothetical protein FXO38_25014 [Capsicum annuum]|nr:hypothetical protein FXO38_25014 [Capsicum annuum]
MSLIGSNNCDYDIGDYDCSEECCGYEEDGDYGGYEYIHDQELNENEGYYSEGEFEMTYDPSSYSEYGDDEETCNGSYKKDGASEEYYTSHYEHRGDISYNSFIYKSNEEDGENICENYEDSYSSSYSTYYQSQSGVNGYTSYNRGCPMNRKEYASLKSKGVTSQAFYSNA